MIGLFLAVTLATNPATLTDALSERDWLAVAEREYRAGLEARDDAAAARPHFRAAAAAYEQLWQRGYRHSALTRNLAQASLLADDLAGAIRAYHRGLRLTAHDRELRSGLAAARERVRYPITGNLSEIARARERNSILREAPASTYALAATVIYLLGLLVIARGWMSRRPIWWGFGSVVLILSILVVGSVFWEEKRLEDERQTTIAIVGSGGATLHRGNGTAFPLRITERLPEGVEMRVLVERGGWYQVQLPGGPIGWVDGQAVVLLEPHDKVK